MIEAIGVVVPAHDEETLLPACLMALRQAAGAVSIPVHVVVVADTCTDRTGATARACGAEVISIRARNVGTARAAGMTGLLRLTAGHAPAVTWLATTGADTVAGLVLAPHYSRLSIAGYRDQLEQALAGRAELAFVDSWHLEPGFVDLLADRVRGTTAHVVFTAHSLPARILDEGDPYERQLLETATASAQAAGLSAWSFSYQSASPTGEPWLGPDILDHLDDLHARGVDSVLICPVGFVADHLEIRWDLDTQAQEKARELGMRLSRIEMPNADPAFVAALATIVRRALAVPSIP